MFHGQKWHRASGSPKAKDKLFYSLCRAGCNETCWHLPRLLAALRCPDVNSRRNKKPIYSSKSKSSFSSWTSENPSSPGRSALLGCRLHLGVCSVAAAPSFITPGLFFSPHQATPEEPDGDSGGQSPAVGGQAGAEHPCLAPRSTGCRTLINCLRSLSLGQGLCFGCTHVFFVHQIPVCPCVPLVPAVPVWFPSASLS